MEEGETVEIQETREPLREQGSIRALLELLEQQGMWCGSRGVEDKYGTKEKKKR